MTDWLGTTTFELDFLHQLTAATDHAGKRAEYTYDGMGRVTEMRYPNGWIEQYTYDAEGNLLKTVDTDPFQLYNKTPKVKYEYTYDAEGNVLTAAELNQDLPQIVADYNERFSHSKPCPLYGSVKDYAASCADLQQLYEAVGWAAEGGLYAEV